MFKVKCHHIALKTSHFEVMKKFYTETLGMDEVGAIPAGGIVFLDCGGTTIELSSTDDPIVACKAGFVHIGFEVDDIDAFATELKSQGVEFFVEPETFQDIRLAFFYDPDGNQIELFKSPSLSWY